LVACDCFSAQARVRVTIQQVTLTDDNIGGKTKSWSDFKTIWAIIKAVPNWRRMEMFVAQEVQARIQQTVTIRYIDAIADNSVASALRISLIRAF
jgi:head-tail adaptor